MYKILDALWSPAAQDIFPPTRICPTAQPLLNKFVEPQHLPISVFCNIVHMGSSSVAGAQYVSDANLNHLTLIKWPLEDLLHFVSRRFPAFYFNFFMVKSVPGLRWLSVLCWQWKYDSFALPLNKNEHKYELR